MYVYVLLLLDLDTFSRKVSLGLLFLFNMMSSNQFLCGGLPVSLSSVPGLRPPCLKCKGELPLGLYSLCHGFLQSVEEVLS